MYRIFIPESPKLSEQTPDKNRHTGKSVVPNDKCYYVVFMALGPDILLTFTSNDNPSAEYAHNLFVATI